MRLFKRYTFIFCCLLSLLFALPLAASAQAPFKILVLGDSLSAAYNMPVEKGWVSLMATRLGDTYHVTNASISGQTTGNGVQQIDNLLKKHSPNLVILELGGNDGLRGQSLKTMRSNLSTMIEKSQAIQSKVLLLGMKIPPNYGRRYTEKFEAIYQQLAEKYQTAFIPFFLQDIATEQELMQPDGIHPNKQAQPMLAKRVEDQIVNIAKSQ
jgi:acyl-CoA thioesterase-1